jgi:hypothetical protein
MYIYMENFLLLHCPHAAVTLLDTVFTKCRYIYIENQFFVSATDDSDRELGNRIGVAMVFLTPEPLLSDTKSDSFE